MTAIVLPLKRRAAAANHGVDATMAALWSNSQFAAIESALSAGSLESNTDEARHAFWRALSIARRGESTSLAELTHAADLCDEARLEAHSLILASAAITHMLVENGDFRGHARWIDRLLAANSDGAEVASIPAVLSPEMRLTCAKLASVLLAVDNVGDYGELAALASDRVFACDDYAAATNAANSILGWFDFSGQHVRAFAMQSHVAGLLAGTPQIGVAERWSQAHWLTEWQKWLTDIDRNNECESLRMHVRRSDELAVPAAQFRARRTLAFFHILRRETVEASALLKEMRPLLSATRPQHWVVFYYCSTMNAIVQRDVDTATASMNAMLGELKKSDTPKPYRSPLENIELVVHMLAGRYDDAIAWAETRARGVSETHRDHVLLAAAELCRVFQIDDSGDGNPPIRAALREHLARGLRIYRLHHMKRFMPLLPHLRARAIALALREDIDTEHCLAELHENPLPPPDDAGPHWPWVLKIYCLSEFAVSGAPALTKAMQRRHQMPVQLLKRLAIDPAANVAMDDIIDALWPDADGDRARATLEMTLSRLRALLPDETLIVREGNRLRLDTSRVWVDRRALQRHLDREIGDPVRDAQRFFALYRGALLGGEEAPWIDAQAARLRTQAHARVRTLIEKQLSAASPNEIEEIVKKAFDAKLDTNMLLRPLRRASNDDCDAEFRLSTLRATYTSTATNAHCLG